MTMIKLIDVARKQFERKFHPESLRTNKDGDYILTHVQSAWINFLAGFVAAHEWDARLPPTYEGLNGPVIDLDLEAWESVKVAASQSTWIPEEYHVNDWVYDVRNFLRNGVQNPEA